MQAVRLSEFINRDDIRMIQLREGAGFAGETFGKTRIRLFKRFHLFCPFFWICLFRL